MPTQLTEKDFLLLGYAKAELVKNTETHSVFDAQADAGLKKITERFIYIKSSASLEDAILAISIYDTARNAYVILPKSREDRITALDRSKSIKGRVFIYETLIWEKLEQIFGEYVESLKDGIPIPRPFVPPRENNYPKENVGQAIIELLSETTKDHKRSSLLVLLAPAGLGKTSVSRWLAVNLAKTAFRKKRIPVYVESSHWRQARFSLDHTDDLWSIVSNSLKQFSPNIDLPKELYEHLLVQGDLVFIFDGFDELCNTNSALFTPLSIIKELSQLVSSYNANVVVTSRDTYWETEVGDDAGPILRKTLAPFVKQQAHKYFEDRFKNSKERLKAARELLGRLRSANSPTTKGGGKNQITYHPYVVEMIGSLVELEKTQNSALFNSPSVAMGDILLRMCERETERQSLATKARDQIRALQEIAVELLGDSETSFSLELLEAAGIECDDMEKIKTHPLLNMVVTEKTSANEMAFKYEFIPYLLGAKQIVTELVSFDMGESKEISSGALRIFKKFTKGGSQLFDHLAQTWPTDTEPTVCYRIKRQYSANQPNISSFLVHFSSAILRDKVVRREERTERVFSSVFGRDCVDRKVIQMVNLEGGFDRLDLRGMTFKKIIFRDATFQGCAADEYTRFEQCAFRGTFQIVGHGRKDWTNVEIVDCMDMDLASRITWEELKQGSSGNREQYISELLEVALKKFWRNGQIKKHILVDDWNKGILQEVDRGKQIISAMKNAGLVIENPGAGNRAALYEFNTDYIGDLQRFMDNRQKTGVVRDLFTNLKSSM